MEYGEKMDKIIADAIRKDKEIIEKNKNIDFTAKLAKLIIFAA